MAVIDFFDRGWRANADGVAYAMGEQELTFDEAGRMSCRIANALIREGLGLEAKAAVLSPNDPLAWVCVLGIWRAGLAWVPLNPATRPDDLVGILDRFDCELLFVHPALDDVVAELRDRLPKLRRIVCIEGEGGPSASLDDWLDGEPATDPRVFPPAQAVAAVAPTGGTTGLPKGVMNTHRSFAAMVAHLMLALGYGEQESVVNLAAAPMTHAAGLFSIPTSARGGTVAILPKPQSSSILEAIERHGVTELFLPPTSIYRLLESPDLERRNLSSLRYLIYGAAPMSTAKLARAIELLGPVMIECYGQMEAPCGIAFMRPEEHFVDGLLAPESRLASCGRPYPLVSVEVRDDDDRPVPVGASGEICVRGDLVMKGYYNAPALTADALVGGWLHTGDVGHLDAHGRLTITDRKKDMIISGGYNVYPSRIEQVIWSHPAVQDCAVIGVPDDDWGEAVKAVVELNPGAEVDPAELVALCKERLGSVEAPKSVDVVASLPRSANGKVLKKDVRERYWATEARRV
jgi:acyl-CoA synthetase (AMP-forming)/AMP-acid ligase II